jgi:hypothetical protein
VRETAKPQRKGREEEEEEEEKKKKKEEVDMCIFCSVARPCLSDV